jgi:2-polyprenyl-6-methoxyphenol hydroxylase-like FAD-dependent oxidoreductase
MKQVHVLIAGCGRVGVVAALACAQRGYRVTLL